MKVLMVLAVVVAVAVADMCRTDMDCANHNITSCSSGYNLVCRNNRCECANAGSGNTCTVQSDCKCDNGTPHCVDGHCRCFKV